jgi:hypothetical protein
MNYGKERSNQLVASLKKPYRIPKLAVHGTVGRITAQQCPPPDHAQGKGNVGGNDEFMCQPHS